MGVVCSRVMFVWIAGGVCLLLLVFWGVVRSRSTRKITSDGIELKEIPLAEGYLPIVGHLWEYSSQPDPDNLLPLVEQQIKAAGDVKTYQAKVPGRTYVLTANPDHIKHITSTKFETVYKKGDKVYKQYAPLFGNGIFNVNGDEWKRHRNIASGLFHIQKLKGFVEVFHQNAIRLFQQIESLDKLSADGIDMQDYFMRYTLDSFGEIGKISSLFVKVSRDSDMIVDY